MESLGRIIKERQTTREKKNKELTPEQRAERVAIMADRYAKGLDIWTGQPLSTVTENE